MLSYGVGNVPSTRSDFLKCIKEATERGVVIVNCTQCCKFVHVPLSNEKESNLENVAKILMNQSKELCLPLIKQAQYYMSLVL